MVHASRLSRIRETSSWRDPVGKAAAGDGLVLGIALMMAAQLLRRYHMVSSALAGGADGQGRSQGQHGRGPRGHLHSRRLWPLLPVLRRKQLDTEEFRSIVMEIAAGDFQGPSLGDLTFGNHLG